MPRFLVDAMCGKLRTYLRMCGYDTAYVLDRDEAGKSRIDSPADEEISEWARESDRTLITRDVALADRVRDALLLSSRDIVDQLREVHAAGYELSLSEPPSRCSVCNGRLRAVDAGESLSAEMPDPAETPCWRCRDCGQVFWRGSHWDDVAATLEDVREPE